MQDFLAGDLNHLNGKLINHHHVNQLNKCGLNTEWSEHLCVDDVLMSAFQYVFSAC